MTLRIPIAVSARHAHLTQRTIDLLFGPGYLLRPRAWLSQTGQFAAQESVTVIGPKGRLARVRLMGPPRARDQVEVSRTDELALGIDAPVRMSGDLAGTPGVTLEGPCGRAQLTSGLMDTDEANAAAVESGATAELIRPRRPASGAS